MRMMLEAWAFRRGQAGLVVPTWGNTAPDLGYERFFCTLIEGQRGRGENVFFLIGDTKYYKSGTWRQTGQIEKYPADG